MNETTKHEPTVVRTERGLSISGTRITLYAIMDYLKEGWPPRLIRDWLNLTDQQIDDVIQYVADHRESVEAEYRQVLQEAAETRSYWEERNRDRLAEIAAMPPKPEHAELWAKLQANKARHRPS